MKVIKTLDKRTLINMYVFADSEKKRIEIAKAIGKYYPM